MEFVTRERRRPTGQERGPETPEAQPEPTSRTFRGAATLPTGMPAFPQLNGIVRQAPVGWAASAPVP